MGRIRVGTPQVRQDAPSHIEGVPEGNAPERTQPGHNADGTVDARRSTGINDRKRNPILPIMPNIPPG